MNFQMTHPNIAAREFPDDDVFGFTSNDNGERSNVHGLSKMGIGLGNNSKMGTGLVNNS